MGIYWIIANHTKKQRIEPGEMKFATGEPWNAIKVPGVYRGCAACALGILLSASDYPEGAGAWSGDHVEYLGDFGTPYDKACDEYEDITKHAVELVNRLHFDKAVHDPL